jgi:predicted nuclease with TOPRIM domain
MENNIKNETLENFFITKYKELESQNIELKKENERLLKMEKLLDKKEQMLKSLFSNCEIVCYDDLSDKFKDLETTINMKLSCKFLDYDIKNGVYKYDDTIGSNFIDAIIIYGSSKISEKTRNSLINARGKD